MYGGAVGEVVSGDEAGTLVVHQLGWREHAIVDADRVRRAAVPDGVPASALLGALGMPGLTAWVGVTDIAPVAEGETVFVSAAAGAVGSVAGQIAKARGCRVIGSAGAPEKVAYVRDELGFDAAFSHHDDVRAALREAAPDGIDVYFDNVGGPQLEAVIGRLNQHGRIALCGAVSQYNATEPAPGPRNLGLLVGKRARLRGFIISDHADREPDFRAEVGALIADGRLKLAETVVDGGIEAAPARSPTCCAGSTWARSSWRCSSAEAQRRDPPPPRRAGRARGAARPPRRPVLGQARRRRLVDPEGRVRGRRGAAGGRAARVRGGDRVGARARGRAGGARRGAPEEPQGGQRVGGRGRRRRGRGALEHVRDGVAAAVGAAAGVPGDRSRRVVPARAGARQADRGAGGVPRPAGGARSRPRGRGARGSARRWSARRRPSPRGSRGPTCGAAARRPRRP